MADDVQRVFFAVELGDAAREAALEVIAELRKRDERKDVRWVRPEALHVTLRFLGDVETARLGGLVSAVAKEAAAVAPFEIGLGTLMAFPTPRRPRVVALSALPAEPLARAAAAVERGVVAAGFAPEARPLRGHLTLGRVRGGRLPHSLLDDVAVPDHTPSTLTEVTEAVLLASELRPEGSRYTPLERVPFGGANGANDSEPRL